MNKTIWKYVLDPRRVHGNALIVSMPKGCNLIHAAGQQDQICVWAEVDPKEIERVDIVFEIYGTGHEFFNSSIAGTREYLGTALIYNGGLVFHVYVWNEA